MICMVIVKIVDHWVVTVLAYMTPYNLHGNFSFRGMGVLVTMGLKIVVLSLLADSRSCLRWSFKQRFPSSLCKSAAIIQREPVVRCVHVTWVRYFTCRVGVVRPLLALYIHWAIDTPAFMRYN